MFSTTPTLQVHLPSSLLSTLTSLTPHSTARSPAVWTSLPPSATSPDSSGYVLPAITIQPRDSHTIYAEVEVKIVLL